VLAPRRAERVVGGLCPETIRLGLFGLSAKGIVFKCRLGVIGVSNAFQLTEASGVSVYADTIIG